jgi:hypothetical protein
MNISPSILNLENLTVDQQTALASFDKMNIFGIQNFG